jgi:hypothetical protein
MPFATWKLAKEVHPTVPVENYFESRYYIELRKAHNLFEWLVSRDTEAGRRSYS